MHGVIEVRIEVDVGSILVVGSKASIVEGVVVERKVPFGVDVEAVEEVAHTDGIIPESGATSTICAGGGGSRN